MMMKTKKYFSRALMIGLFIASAGLLILGSGASAAPPDSVPVRVINPETEPVPVRDVDAQPDMREPVQFRGVPTLFDGGVGTVALVTVPNDKTLVIEHVSISVNDNSGSGLSSCTLSLSTLGSPADYMPCISMGSNALNHFYAANHTTKFYAGPGTTVRLTTVTLAFDGEGSITGFISGYYLPAP